MLQVENVSTVERRYLSYSFSSLARLCRYPVGGVHAIQEDGQNNFFST
jgi:hypothetical protein